MKPSADSNHCGQLDEYLAGGLSGDELRRYAAHLEGCPACREEVAAQRAIDGLLREGAEVAAGRRNETASSAAVPVELAGRIETAWRQQRQRRRRRVAWGTVAALAAVSLIAVSLWAIGSGGPGAARPPVAEGTDTTTPRPNEQEKEKPAPQQNQSSEAVAQAPAAERVRVAFDDPQRQIAVPVESPSPNVTIYWVYPTIQTGQTAHAETSGDSSSITNSNGSKT